MRLLSTVRVGGNLGLAGIRWPTGHFYCRSPRGRTPEGRHCVWLPTSASLESDSFERRCRPARLLLGSASAGPSGRRVCANLTLDVTM